MIIIANQNKHGASQENVDSLSNHETKVKNEDSRIENTNFMSKCLPSFGFLFATLTSNICTIEDYLIFSYVQMGTIFYTPYL